MGFRWFSVLLDENIWPCFLIDLETDRILYMNTKMQDLQKNQEDVLGRKFYEVICHPELSGDQEKLGEKLGDSYEAEIFDDYLEKRFLCQHSFVNFDGITYLLCKYKEIEGENKRISLEDAMTCCVGILQQDEEGILSSFLELLGDFYQSQKTYLYRVDPNFFTATLEKSWVSEENVPVVANVGSKMDVLTLLNWLGTRNEVGIIEADGHCVGLSEDVVGQKLLETFDLKNIVLSAIEDGNGDVMAVVGVGNRADNGEDYRLLQAVSEFIKQMLTKAEMNTNFCELNQSDILTGFSSRSSYAMKVEEFGINPPKTMAVVFANVNGVKQVNTEFGYAKGDILIKKSATELKNHFDTEFYRVSGDEFVAFFPDMEKSAFQELVGKLQDKMKAEGNDNFAVGQAWGSGHYDVMKLVEEADVVMYINKQEFYHNSKRQFFDVGDKTLGDLLSYLENDEFLVYLQPQMNLKDESLYGAEALVRRFDKTEQKMVFPDQFIPLYEKKFVIRHVDIFVVKEVCKLLQRLGKEWKQFPISVNLSRVTLLEFGIVDTIAKICDKYEIPHEMLVIEVTERVGLIENNVESSLITEFAEKGFKISLDDFGCAYSNIVTLSQISVDEVKLDKSLVDFITSNEKNRILVKNILAMCNELKDTSTLAEGIETKEQADLLRQYDCHLGQGYYYSRPIPVDEFCEKYLK